MSKNGKLIDPPLGFKSDILGPSLCSERKKHYLYRITLFEKTCPPKSPFFRFFIFYFLCTKKYKNESLEAERLLVDYFFLNETQYFRYVFNNILPQSHSTYAELRYCDPQYFNQKYHNFHRFINVLKTVYQVRKLNITFKIVNSGHFLDIFEADCRSASEQLIINVLDFD